MSAMKLQCTLNEIERNMMELAPYRKPALFNNFLVNGYTAVTLSSVPRDKFSELLQAKLCLGTLITLYDDFADRPAQNDPELLEVLYRLRFANEGSTKGLDPRGGQALNFANVLFARMEEILMPLPHYRRLCEILNFDLQQFYSANRYGSLLTANPYIHNRLENRLYSHHNMGMVMAALMDLMATERIDFAEFGAMREIFVMGQRMGRIFNVLATRKREVIDGDITGELATCSNECEFQIAEGQLRQEIKDLRAKIMSFEARVSNFSVMAYLDGLAKVQTLHEELEGTI